MPLRISLNKLQLNFVISNTHILNTTDMSKWFVSPNHLYFKYFTLDISKFITSPIEYKITRFDCVL